MTAVLAVLAVLLHTRAAHTQVNSSALTPLDYIAIQQLVSKYAYAIDVCTNKGYDYTPQGWRFKSRVHVLAAGQAEVSRGSRPDAK